MFRPYSGKLANMGIMDESGLSGIEILHYGIIHHVAKEIPHGHNSVQEANKIQRDIGMFIPASGHK